MKQRHIHCIGIGGIGVSALARLYRSRGFRVSGSDLAKSEITEKLQKEGIAVSIGPHRASNISKGATAVIYTAALKPSNPELREATRRKIKTQSYAEAIGELTRQFQTIAVAGAHGKSTTTALTSLVLNHGGIDPTVIVGTKLREFKNSNFRRGRSEYLVLEADEYRTSFTNYTPFIVVVTNIDREHLDFYKSISRIEAAFKKFLLRLRPGGILVLNRDNQRLARIGEWLKKQAGAKVIWYSLRDRRAERVARHLQIPGKHNVSNALAAHAVGRIFKIPEKTIFSALHSYCGAWRRFDYQGVFCFKNSSGRRGGAKIFADYAHHPTEIAATIQGTREKFPNSRIWCVFQPHHYERTRDLFREFARSFDGCNAVVMLDIYEVAGREKKNKSPKINSKTLAEAIARRGVAAHYLRAPKRLKMFLQKNLAAGDVVLMMGAGSIWEMTKKLMKKKEKEK